MWKKISKLLDSAAAQEASQPTVFSKMFAPSRPRVKPRRLQEELDMIRLYILAQNLEQRTNPNAEIVDLDKDKLPPFEVQAAKVQEYFLKQATHLLEGVRSAEQDKIVDIPTGRNFLIPNRSNRHEPHSAPRSDNPDMPAFGVPIFKRAPSAATDRPEITDLRKYLKDKLGFTLYVDQSTAPNAGLGLFIDGHCPMGGVVSFYPGLVYTKSFLRSITFKLPNGEPNLWLMTRFDSTIVDGNLDDHNAFNGFDQLQSELESSNSKIVGVSPAAAREHEAAEPGFMSTAMQQLAEQAKVDEEAEEEKSANKKVKRESQYSISGIDPERLEMLARKFSHPFALSHMVNHPPKGGSANILPASLDIPFDFPKELLPYVPNKFYQLPNPEEEILTSLMRSIVYVAQRPLRDEELFVNYRLNPKLPLPEWYSPVNSEEDARRWTKN